MVVLVSAFFLLGFFSVYVRQCAERGRYGRNLDPTIAAAIQAGTRGPHGLDVSVIETFPIFPYSAVKNLKIGKGTLECAVCLNEFEDDATLRLIPKCSHVFHPECIDAWFAAHTTCPVCRANLVPKPGEPVPGLVHILEPDSVLGEARVGQNDEVEIHVDEGCNRAVSQVQGQEVNLLNPTVQNRPPRSKSTGWRITGLFPRSHSTGHSLVQRGESLERFTLRLSDDARSQLLNVQLNRTKSCVAFQRVRSSRRGYRSGSGGFYQYERFDQEQGQPNGWGFSRARSFLSRSGSVHSSKGVGGEDDQVRVGTLKRFSKSVKSPFDRLFLGLDKRTGPTESSNVVGERSSDQLRPDSQV